MSCSVRIHEFGGPEVLKIEDVVVPDPGPGQVREGRGYRHEVHFGPDGLLRRHDYAVDILGGATGALYIGDHREHGGIKVPHSRRVYPLGADNRKIPQPVLIAIDIVSLGFGPP